MKNVFKYVSVIGCTFASINFAKEYIDYKVKSGDTLYEIAFSHNMNVSEFLKINNIKDANTYNLKAGEILKIKNSEYKLVYDDNNKVYGLKSEESTSYKDYKVKSGDTLYEIAFSHNMNVSEFLKINNIKDANTYNLKVGEILKIVNDSKISSIENKSYKDYKVKSGDTLYKIAFSHNMNVSEFLKINNIKDANTYKLYVGKIMKVIDNNKKYNSNNSQNNDYSIEYYTVKGGDTLYKIAFENDISVNEFLKINDIKEPLKYKLNIGEKLKIYSKNKKLNSKTIKTYKVKNGDTLSEIAEKNSMSLKDLLELNELSDKYVLKVGDTIKIYDNVNINTSENNTLKTQYKTLEDYKVKSGDTLSEIAAYRSMDLVELYYINNLNDKYILKAGDILKVYSLPKKTKTWVVSNYKIKSGDTLYKIAKNNQMELRDLIKLNNIKNVNEYKLYVGKNLKIKTLKMVAYSFTDDSILPESSFIWPYRGIIVSGYGVSSDNLANRGINILGDVGDNVIASDDGIVEYVDSIRGFGTVIIIKHKNGYNTSYAHLSKVNVKLGDFVSKGSYIGDIGDTGMIDRSELYFKISYQGRAVDPIKLLPKD